MRNKKADTLYCDVRKNVILNADPVYSEENMTEFMYFLKERYKIHIKKDIMLKKKPYTKDELLKKYRFTNVRREHDKETKWLINNITDNAFLTYRQKLINCILFRLYNKHETMEIMGAPFKIEAVWTFVPPRNKLQAYKTTHPKYNFFTRSFNTSGLKRILNIKYRAEKFAPARVLRLIFEINTDGTMNSIMEAENQKEVFEALKTITGVGDFLAYQIFVDFTYIKEFPFSENEFTVAGPGCKRGIDILFSDRDGMTYEECIFWLRNNWYKIGETMEDEDFFDPKEEMVDLKQYDRVMNVMSLENCLCEYSKYCILY